MYSANQNIYEVMGKNGAKNLLPNIGASNTINGITYTVNEDGSVEYKDLSDVCVENVKKDGFDCIFTLIKRAIKRAYGLDYNEMIEYYYLSHGLPLELANRREVKRS